MKKIIKKISAIFVVIYCAFITKIQATVIPPDVPAAVYGVNSPSPITKAFIILKIFVMPIVFVFGLIVVVVNCFKYFSYKKEMNSKHQGQRLYGTPSVITKTRKIENDEIKRLKGNVIKNLIVISIIAIIWIGIIVILNLGYYSVIN